jgi:hypothetical protein
MQLSTERRITLDAIQFVEDAGEPIAAWTLDELDHDFGPVCATWTRTRDQDA